MSLNRWAKKRDENEADIFETLRAHGLSVEPIDTPADAIVGYGGRTYLVEVKRPKKKGQAAGKLTPPQEAFLETWKGDHTILRTVEEATSFAQIVRSVFN